MVAVFAALTWGGGIVSVPVYAVSGSTVAETVNTYEIKGRVVDELREPLPGASVRIKGTTVGTVTILTAISGLKCRQTEGDRGSVFLRPENDGNHRNSGKNGLRGNAVGRKYA